MDVRTPTKLLKTAGCVYIKCVPSSQHVCILPWQFPQAHRFRSAHCGKIIGIQWRAKWDGSKARRRLRGIREMKEGVRWGEIGHKGEAMQQILPSGQTGSPHRAALLTRGLMGKLITPCLYSSGGRSSPSHLILLSCRCEVLSLTVRAGAKFRPGYLSPSTTQGLEDQDSFWLTVSLYR